MLLQATFGEKAREADPALERFNFLVLLFHVSEIRCLVKKYPPAHATGKVRNGFITALENGFPGPP